MTNENKALAYVDERIEVLKENYEFSAELEHDLKQAYYEYFIEERDGNAETVSRTMERVAELYQKVVENNL